MAVGTAILSQLFACGRAESLPFADASFDIVWCTDVLEHLSDLPAAIAQIARVLKPGGLFLYDTINRTWLSRPLVIWFWEYLAGLAPRGTHDWRLFLRPPGTPPSADPTRHAVVVPSSGMLPVWLSPRQGWRFRLVRYTGILYLGYAVKRAKESSSYAVSSRTRNSDAMTFVRVVCLRVATRHRHRLAGAGQAAQAEVE